MKNNSGFTLMELMIVIAIIGIVTAIAVPNMISWRSNHQLNGSAREVLSVINGARLAAIKNNATVTVTFNDGAKTVETSVTNRLTGVTPPPKTTNLKLGINSVSAFTDGNTFGFNSRGFPIAIGGGFAAGRVTLTNTKGDSLEVIMASTGNTRIDKP